MHRIACIGTILVALLAAAHPVRGNEQEITFERDKDVGELSIQVDGQEALVYQYGPDEDLAHYWPVRSPSGASMTVQHPDPYPHHRSFWFADEVKLEGHEPVNFYNAWYTREKGTDHPCPFRHRIRHRNFLPPEQVDLLEESADGRNLAMKLDWEMDWDTRVLTETREMQVTPLGDGEYFLDIVFRVTASNGDVTFTSDWVHYAWPYIRMNEDFNVKDGGGRIVSSAGGVNREGTNAKEAKWVDYSAPSGEGTEGLAIFSHPDNRQPHRWLTRDYGCFGPRRVRKRSGKEFTLQQGESLERRVGVFVHRGDVESGRVAEWYRAYVEGDL